VGLGGARYNPAEFNTNPSFKEFIMRKFWLALSSWMMACTAMAATPGSLRVPLTTGTHVYFKGDDNRREQSVQVNLPESIDDYGRVTLQFKLSCPDGKCDRWDRVGTMSLQNDDYYQPLELLRFITPYGIGANWTYDLSDFLPLLQGPATFRFFIDTWVGPGHPQGNGWMIEAELVYEKASDDRPVAGYVQPIMTFEDVVYGDPLVSTERKSRVLPLVGYRSAQMRMVITGHGQGNDGNCAEFCSKSHQVTIGKQRYEATIWRDNCATTVDPNQKGTWQYPRAGWCPGDKVEPWKADVTTALLNGTTDFIYQPEAFENTCRPGVLDCSACVFGTGCEYDGGLHTEPRYFVSAYLIYYK
jgi:hypothetical protein